jgi:acyl dehydratase
LTATLASTTTRLNVAGLAQEIGAVGRHRAGKAVPPGSLLEALENRGIEISGQDLRHRTSFATRRQGATASKTIAGGGSGVQGGRAAGRRHVRCGRPLLERSLRDRLRVSGAPGGIGYHRCPSPCREGGSVPIYLEDFHAGDVAETPARRVSREEMVAFAREFDPQPFHVDEEAAKRSPFGGLVASGWHTASLCMRMVVEHALASDGETGSLGSPGVDELRWLRPVRPGDSLTVRIEVLEVVPSRSKADRGLVKLRYTMRNQDAQDVMTMVALGIMRRRP